MEENMKNENGAEVKTEPETEVTEKTYTQEEVDALLQREADRRVNSALKKQQAKFENKIAEAEKLRGMDEEQRKAYEFDQRVKQFEEREKEFNLAQNKLEATKVLANRNLPIEFVDYIVAEDAETMLENINTFEKAFKAAVSDAVSRKIASPTPKAGARQTGLTREEFSKMTIAQQMEVYNTNPQLYKSFTE